MPPNCTRGIIHALANAAQIGDPSKHQKTNRRKARRLKASRQRIKRQVANRSRQAVHATGLCNKTERVPDDSIDEPRAHDQLADNRTLTRSG